MSRWSPCKRREFIRKIRKLGFEGPVSGTRHQFMIYQRNRLTLPSNDEYSIPQLKMMVGEVEEILQREIVLEDWEQL